MANVPWHEEVVSFVRLLCERLPQFDLACEHEHSNCLLLANTKVRKTKISIKDFIFMKNIIFSFVLMVNGIHGLIMIDFMNLLHDIKLHQVLNHLIH